MWVGVGTFVFLLRFIVGASLSDTIGCSDILQAYNLCKL